MQNTDYEPLLTTIIVIGPLDDFAYVHLNTGKPYWKKKYVKLIPKCQQVMLDLVYPLDLKKLFIKIGGKNDLFPLKDYCEYHLPNKK
jgi:hypothetical protein